MRSVLAPAAWRGETATNATSEASKKRRMGDPCHLKRAPASTSFASIALALYSLAATTEDPHRGIEQGGRLFRYRHRYRCRQDGRFGLARGASRGELLEAGPGRQSSGNGFRNRAPADRG